MKETPERILVILFGAIGDVTRALPLLGRLRRAYPGARLSWAVEPLAAPLLADHPALDEIIVFARERGARGFIDFLRSVRGRRFDLVLDLGRHLKSGIASLISGAPRRIGFHRRNGREGNWLFQTETIPPQQHYSSKLRQYLCFGDRLGLHDEEIRFGLVPSDASRREADELLRGVRRPFVAFVLGSSCPARRWFPDRTAATAGVLRDRYGYSAVLLGTAADRLFADAVGAGLESPGRDLVGRTSLANAVAVLEQAALTITPDSGAMHIAAALGVPVVSLWGATSADRSAPFGWEDGTLVGPATCAPCYLRDCPIGRACMRKIRVANVVERVAQVMNDAAC